MLNMADETQNKQAMKEAVDTLNLIISTNSTPKTIKTVSYTHLTLPTIYSV